jgi:hypothetical protein
MGEGCSGLCGRTLTGSPKMGALYSPLQGSIMGVVFRSLFHVFSGTIMPR